MGYAWTPGVESWDSYLHNRAILDEQLGGMRRAGRESARGMQEMGDRLSREITSGIADQTRDILGSMESLSSALSSDLSALSAGLESGLDHVAGALEHGFAGMLRESKAIKRELKRLVDLVEYEEQKKAMENFRYAVHSMERGLWDEAQDYVTAAIEGDSHSKGYKLDWHFHWLKGELLLGAPARHDWKGLDPSAAEQCFALAAKYARKDAPREAARALLMASVAAYVQSADDPAKLQDMLAHAESAWSLDGALTEAAFQVARARMLLDRPQEALPALRSAIEQDALFAVRAAEDPGHQRHQADLDGFLRTLREEAALDVRRRAGQAAQAFEPLAARSRELAGLPELLRLQRLAGGQDGQGLVDLLRYRSAGLEADRAACQQTVERLRRTVRMERSSGGPPRRVEVVEEAPAPPPQPQGFFATLKAAFAGPPAAPATRQVRRTVEVPAPERWTLVNGLGEEVRDASAVTFVHVQPGRFLMGSPPGEKDRGSAEEQHEVVLTRPFLLGTAPVTQQEYQAVMGTNPSRFAGGNLPVEQVSWFDAVAFCNALSRGEGLEEAYLVQGSDVRWKGPDCPGWRLPTEAEWEYACRAGTTGARYGNLDDIAWHSGNAGGQTHPVRQKAPNAWGLFDMLGNVWEWCWDWYATYPGGRVVDPVGSDSGSYRVARGGSWYLGAQCARAAARGYVAPSARAGNLGFRLARSLPQAAGRTVGS